MLSHVVGQPLHLIMCAGCMPDDSKRVARDAALMMPRTASYATDVVRFDVGKSFSLSTV